MKKINIILTFSLLLNIALIAYGFRVVNGLGGITYLKNRFSGKVNESDFQIFYKTKRIIHRSLPHHQKEILFIGDSLTDYCEWNELFDNSNIKNRGIAGDDIQGVTSRLDEMLSSKPEKIFLMIGINNLNHKNTVQQTLTAYELLLAELKKKSPSTKVYVESILPRLSMDKSFNPNIITINKKLAVLSHQFNFTYINLFDSFTDKNGDLDTRYSIDGLHLNGEGYKLWRDGIKNQLNEQI